MVRRNSLCYNKLEKNGQALCDKGRKSSGEGCLVNMGTRESQLFFRQNGTAPLGIIATEGAKELAGRIDAYLVKWAKEAGIEKDTFIIDRNAPVFLSGRCQRSDQIHRTWYGPVLCRRRGQLQH